MSNERLDLLDADLTVMFPIGDGRAREAAVRPAAQRHPVGPVTADMVIIDDLTLGNAFSSGTTLGTLYAIENVVPLFSTALS